MHTPACLISANPPSLLIGFAHTFGVVSHSNMLVRVVWHRDQLLRVLERAVQPADHPRYSQQTSPTSPTSPTPPRLALSDMCVNSGSNNAPTLQYVLTVQRKKLVWVLIFGHTSVLARCQDRQVEGRTAANNRDLLEIKFCAPTPSTCILFTCFDWGGPPYKQFSSLSQHTGRAG